MDLHVAAAQVHVEADILEHATEALDRRGMVAGGGCDPSQPEPPGSRLGPWDYPHIAWSSHGDWVFFSNGDLLVAHRPGDGASYRVPIELTPPYYGMAAG